MSRNRFPKSASSSPVSGFAPSWLMWSVMMNRSPAAWSSRMPPQALETMSTLMPSLIMTHTGSVISRIE